MNNLTADTLTATGDIAHIIQLAVAPVFLIAGIGALLNVLTARLGRVVDRGRVLEAALAREAASERSGETHQRLVLELRSIDKRLARINAAVTLSTLAALLVCLVIVTLFTGEMLGVDLSQIIAVLFIATMAVLIAGLVFFLGEISIATRVLRVRTELLEKT